MSITALKTLIESSKATVLMAVLTIATVALWQGLIAEAEWTSIIKMIVPAWMLAHAGERGAKHLAASKPQPAAQASSAAISHSEPPPSIPVEVDD